MASLRFPDTAEQQKEIPIYVHFAAHQFTSDLETRNRPIGSFWHKSDFGQVYLPVNNEIGTAITMQYSSNPSQILQNRSLKSNRIDRSTDPDTLQGLQGDAPQGGLRGVLSRNRTGTRKDNFLTAKNNDMDHAYQNFLDVVDTTWLGQTRRRYNFNFVLSNKSTGDARASINICNFFSNRLLSRMFPQNINSTSANQRSHHPPMWSINCCNYGGGQSDQSTVNWMGTYPQLCVLEDVRAFRTGGDGVSILAMQEKDGFPLPLQCHLSLQFIELEPVYVNANTYDMLAPCASRSQFFNI